MIRFQAKMVAVVNCSFLLQYCKVPNQDIFEVHQHSKRVIDAHGSAVLKFRITQVSHQHQRRLFQVEIAARRNPDISPVLCTPVDIKSKRNLPPKSKNDSGAMYVERSSSGQFGGVPPQPKKSRQGGLFK